MAAWVMLKHELPDGSWHHDWIIERAGSAAESLPTFRVAGEIAWPPVADFEAVRISDHRRAYLTYEGEVRGGRGRVSRVACGEGELHEDGEGLAAEMDGRRWLGRLVGPAVGAGEARWRFEPELPSPDL